MSASTSGMPNYGAIIGQLMGKPPPNANGMFGANPAQAFSQMTNYANQANYQRGQGILNLLQGQGQSQLASNQQNYQNQLGGIQQSMMSKGLANTSVGNNLDQEAQNQLAQNNEGVNEHTALNLANMANSFTQKAPDMGLFAQLMQGRGGGGMSIPAFPTGGKLGGGGGSVVQQQIPQIQHGDPNGQIAGPAMQGNDPNTDMTANPQMTPGNYTIGPDGQPIPIGPDGQPMQSDDEEAQQDFLGSAGQ